MNIFGALTSKKRSKALLCFLKCLKLSHVWLSKSSKIVVHVNIIKPFSNILSFDSSCSSQIIAKSFQVVPGTRFIWWHNNNTSPKVLTNSNIRFHSRSLETCFRARSHANKLYVIWKQRKKKNKVKSTEEKSTKTNGGRYYPKASYIKTTRKLWNVFAEIASFSFKIETYFHYGSLLKGRDLSRSAA